MSRTRKNKEKPGFRRTRRVFLNPNNRPSLAAMLTHVELEPGHLYDWSRLEISDSDSNTVGFHVDVDHEESAKQSLAFLKTLIDELSSFHASLEEAASLCAVARRELKEEAAREKAEKKALPAYKAPEPGVRRGRRVVAKPVSQEG